MLTSSLFKKVQRLVTGGFESATSMTMEWVDMFAEAWFNQHYHNLPSSNADSDDKRKGVHASSDEDGEMTGERLRECVQYRVRLWMKLVRILFGCHAHLAHCKITIFHVQVKEDQKKDVNFVRSKPPELYLSYQLQAAELIATMKIPKRWRNNCKY